MSIEMPFKTNGMNTLTWEAQMNIEKDLLLSPKNDDKISAG